MSWRPCLNYRHWRHLGSATDHWIGPAIRTAFHRSLAWTWTGGWAMRSSIFVLIGGRIRRSRTDSGRAMFVLKKIVCTYNIIIITVKNSNLVSTVTHTKVVVVANLKKNPYIYLNAYTHKCSLFVLAHIKEKEIDIWVLRNKESYRWK